MKRFARFVFAAAFIALSGIAHAGAQAAPPVPTLGEIGLATFAIGLLGGGVFLIRRRPR